MTRAKNFTTLHRMHFILAILLALVPFCDGGSVSAVRGTDNGRLIILEPLPSAVFYDLDEIKIKLSISNIPFNVSLSLRLELPQRVLKDERIEVAATPSSITHLEFVHRLIGQSAYQFTARMYRDGEFIAHTLLIFRIYSSARHYVTPSGCTVYPGTYDEASSMAFRGRVLRENASFVESESCLIDSVTRIVTQHKPNTRSIAFPLTELVRLYKMLHRRVEQKRTEQLLRRLYKGFIVPDTEDPRAIGVDLDISKTAQQNLTDSGHLICAFSANYYLSASGFSSSSTNFGHPTGEHYKLLSLISQFLPEPSLIFDLGTRHGASALALSARQHRIFSFDLNSRDLEDNMNACHMDQLDFKHSFESVMFETGDVLSPYWADLLLGADMIVLDTDHDGPFEWRVYEFLRSRDYRGLLLLDDIYLNPAMEAFWGWISEPKVDLTHVGHVSGTGLVLFDGWPTFRINH